MKTYKCPECKRELKEIELVKIKGNLTCPKCWVKVKEIK